MKAFQYVLPPRTKTNSLFVHLILAFLSIIIVLVTLHFITISISSNKVREEIIKYNTLNLNNTVESYEKHFELLKGTMLSFLIHDDVRQFYKSNQYIKFPIIQAEIQKIVSNSNLFIRDVFLYSKNTSQILDKSKSTSPASMFGVFMYSSQYTEQFWEEQFEADFVYKVLPAVRFEDRASSRATVTSDQLLPVLFKGYAPDQFYIAVLMDAKGMLDQFHISLNENLVILDGQNTIYSNAMPQVAAAMPELMPADKQYVLSNQHYYFYGKGEQTGFTYIHIVPQESIAAQMKMKATLFFVLFAAILASITAALLFIRKINNPLKRVIEALGDMNGGVDLQGSKIKEFHLISDRFKQLAKAKQSIHKELDQEKEQSRHYSYIRQLKEIQLSGGLSKQQELSFTDQPFVVLLFEFIFKQRDEQFRETEKKWYLYAKEFVDISVARGGTEALTLQMERNQVLSLLFLDSGQQLEEILAKVKAVFDLDRDSGYAVIAVSSVYDNSGELTKAYEEAVSYMQYQMFHDETQILSASELSKLQPLFDTHIVVSEQKLDVQISQGNRTEAVELLQKSLAELQKRGSTRTVVAAFIKRVTDKALRALHLAGVPDIELNDFSSAIKRLEQTCNFVELEHALIPLLEQLCKRIEEQKPQQSDTALSFITTYIKEHLAEEIYLDAIAQKLKMSSGYLSVYFKEKTGQNFIDYLNEMRIEQAKQLLEHTDSKVREIAVECGYQNINSFNRMFKKFTGTTPGEYRKQNISDQ